MDRDLKLLGMAAVSAALEKGGEQIASVAVAGADRKFGDVLPFGSVVSDPVFRDLLDEFGVDPDTVWYAPTGLHPGDYTLNDLVGMTNKSGRESLGLWLPEGKGTERGALEVQLVNEFVEEFFPLVSDDGGEWEYKMGVAEMVLHDLLDEQYEEEWPDEYGAQIAFVQSLLEEAGG